MARIFISYRRADSGESAQKLYDALSPHFHVFMDVEGILVGKDFRATIEREIIQSDVVLIVIGPQWMSITDEAGVRRLDKPNDLVRIEAEMALRHEKIVIPVTVAGAAMPSADVMPASLSNLPFLNGERIRPDQRDTDTARLIRQIKRALGQEMEPTQNTVVAPSEPHPIKQIFRNTIWFSGIVVIVVFLLGLGNLVIQALNPTVNLTPTTAAFNPTQPTPLDPVQIVGQTQTHEAGQTLTAIPTATATLTLDFNGTVDAIATGTRAAQQTAEAAATLTTLQAAYDQAAAYDYRAGNAAWTPITLAFDGVPMMLVPAGCFEMGNADGEDIEKPVNRQCFDKPFWIDRTEVTQASFEQLNGQKENPNNSTGSQYPIETISWFEAHDFCRLRGSRLPTEREWEYAARGPDNFIFPWGNDWDPENAVWLENSNRQVEQVGNLLAGASWVGALDMSGNVWEWVNSMYRDYPYNATDGREDSSDSSAFRVMRGGSFDNSLEFMRTAFRVSLPPYDGNFDDGFRCARSP